jgi:hypothetical protein
LIRTWSGRNGGKLCRRSLRINLKKFRYCWCKQRSLFEHSYDILCARMLWKPKDLHKIR